MSRYAARFAELAAPDELAFVPFLVLGDPDPATSLELLRCLARSGADALELGIPFSDPIADGPIIQAAATRALAAGARVAQAWTLVRTVRQEFPDLPIGLLVYANLVLGHGAEAFYAAAAGAGVDSVLVADLPTLEAAQVHAAARRHGVAPILMAPPNADSDRLRAIAAGSEGYVYVTSRPGVTGEDADLHQESRRVIAALRAAGAAPPLLGFGISRPEHVRAARDLGAAGAISGSAVVSRVEAHLGDPGRMLDEVGRFVRSMKAATRG